MVWWETRTIKDWNSFHPNFQQACTLKICPFYWRKNSVPSEQSPRSRWFPRVDWSSRMPFSTCVDGRGAALSSQNSAHSNFGFYWETARVGRTWGPTFAYPNLIASYPQDCGQWSSSWSASASEEVLSSSRLTSRWTGTSASSNGIFLAFYKTSVWF